MFSEKSENRFNQILNAITKKSTLLLVLHINLTHFIWIHNPCFEFWDLLNVLNIFACDYCKKQDYAWWKISRNDFITKGFSLFVEIKFAWIYFYVMSKTISYMLEKMIKTVIHTVWSIIYFKIFIINSLMQQNMYLILESNYSVQIYAKKIKIKRKKY